MPSRVRRIACALRDIVGLCGGHRRSRTHHPPPFREFGVGQLRGWVLQRSNSVRSTEVGVDAEVSGRRRSEAQVIGRCLDSLRTQAAREQMEVVVVANSCVDETASLIPPRGLPPLSPERWKRLPTYLMSSTGLEPRAVSPRVTFRVSDPTAPCLLEGPRPIEQPKTPGRSRRRRRSRNGRSGAGGRPSRRP